MKLIIEISENIYNTIMSDVMPDAGQMSAIITRIYQGKPYEERPQGHWINQSQGAKYPCECSECHTEPFCNDEGYVLSDFCPNCGADMRVKDELKEAENDV